MEIYVILVSTNFIFKIGLSGEHRKSITFFLVFLSDIINHLPGHRRKQLMNFASTRNKRSSNFLLHGKLPNTMSL